MTQNAKIGGFALNLALLIIIGVGTLYWIGFHTELLAVIGGLLGLGGIFAWVAFVSKMIRDDRKNAMQNAFDAWLSRPRTTVVCLLLAVLLAITGGAYGSIQIDSRRDSVDRFIRIIALEGVGKNNRQANTPESAYRSELTEARSTRNFSVFTGFKTRDYEVRIDGLPAVRLTAGGYSRVVLTTPDGFLNKNILLIRPESELSRTLRKADEKNTLTLSVGRGDRHRLYYVPDYRGESIWLGCEETVSIPDNLQQSWRLELLAQKAPQANMLPWLTPLSMGADTILNVGEPIKIQIKHPNDDTAWLTQDSAVENCGKAACFPQEVVMKMPNIAREGNL